MTALDTLITGLHPARLIDPDYLSRERVEARRAAQILEGQR